MRKSGKSNVLSIRLSDAELTKLEEMATVKRAPVATVFRELVANARLIEVKSLAVGSFADVGQHAQV